MDNQVQNQVQNQIQNQNVLENDNQKILNTDKIIKKGLFLGLESKPIEKIAFGESNELSSKILPDDIIEYYINKYNKIIITKIVKRESFYTLAIIKNYEYKDVSESFSNKNLNHHYDLYLPLLSKNFKLNLSLNDKKYDIGDRLLVYFEDIHNNYNIDNFYKIIDEKKYSNVFDRNDDKNILFDVYSNFNLINENLVNIIENIQNKNYYTKNDIIDLTQLNTFNIDPTLSKDFDDAISVDLENNKIYVHIVDINQIPINSIDDKRAGNLGYTLYLNEGNLNMFEEKYSERELSLIKDEIRNVITVEYDIDIENSINNNTTNLPLINKFEIYKSIIKIKERYDYDNIYREINEDIQFLYDFTSKIYKRHIALPVPNYKINNLGKIEKIELEDNSGLSHKLIEMLMILTNKTITEYLNSFEKIPERYHDKTENVDLNIFEHLNLEEQLNEIIKLKTAFYDNTKTSHFALKLNSYCHFTSPIRRYFDIIIHRILAGYKYCNIENLLKHLNKREELNEKIEELYYKWKLTNYLLDHHSKTFEASILKITKNGLKFYIKELGYDGFVLSKNILKNIYWIFDDVNNVLRGKNIEISKEMKINVYASDINFLSDENVTWKILNL